MPNPWVNLPSTAPYVAAADQARLRAMEAGQPAFMSWDLRLNLLPEPWLGDPLSAEVVLLVGNPGWDSNDAHWHGTEAFRAAARTNLLLGQQGFPFYMLDPRFQDSPGGSWWRQRLGDVLSEIGDEERVAQRLAAVEAFPYHAPQALFPVNHGLPSQQYSIELVHGAMKRGALVVVMRRAGDWAARLGARRRIGQRPTFRPLRASPVQELPAPRTRTA